jgi:type IV secretion system protein VirD4
VVQSKQQLHTIYGQEGAENIFLNTGAELLFGGADQRLAEEVSKRAGSDTVQAVSTSRPRFMGWLFPARQSDTEAERPRNLLLPQEVSRLPKDEMIVLRPTLPPLKLRRLVWYTDRWFRGMGGPRLSVPRLALRVERDPASPAPVNDADAARGGEYAQTGDVRARPGAAPAHALDTAAAERPAATTSPIADPGLP